MANFFRRLVLSGGDAASVSPSVGEVWSETAAVREDSRWLMLIARAVILAAIFIIPIIYLNITPDPRFVKVTLTEIAALVAAVAWLLNVLFVRRIDYKRSPVNLIFLLLAVVLIAATVFSSAPWSSFWGADITGEKTTTLIAFVILSFVAAAIFERKHVARAAALLLISFAVLALFALYAVAAAYYKWDLPTWLSVNPVGTTNSLAYVLGIGFVFAATLALTQKTSAGRRMLASFPAILAAVAAALLFLSLVFIGFRMLWVGVSAAMLLILAFNFAKTWTGEGGAAERGFGNIAVGAGFLILVLSLFFVYKPLPLGSEIFRPPLEVSPSLKATIGIGRQILESKPIFGVGPGNFVAAYNLFHDRALNDTPFWTSRFTHGFSLISTLPATVGVLGALVFIALAWSVLAVMGRALWKMGGGGDPIAWAAWGGASLVAVMWFLYASNFTASFLLFIFLGMLTAVFNEGADEVFTSGSGESADTKPSWWRITARSIRTDAPEASPVRTGASRPADGNAILPSATPMTAADPSRPRSNGVNFATSLVVVFAAAFSLVALYSLVTQQFAEIYFRRAINAMNLYGNTDTAKIFLDRAIGLNPVASGYHQAKSQVGLVVLGRIVAKAASGSAEDLSGQFRAELTEAVDSAKRAKDIGGSDPQNWFTLGQVYEAVIPYFPGADKLAIDSYEGGKAVDPLNPILPLAQGRVYLTTADILTLQINQTSSGDERSRLEQLRKETLAKAKDALGSAISLKPDFADAHFLLAQVSIRENNLEEAIRNGAATARLVPGDIGVAFQLGVLYYRADRLDQAKTEFDRAVLLNDNYSNARYFLGLIWDRKGDKDAALSQFQKIAALNPDNEEVKKIIANLAAGKNALDGIVPPAPAPETRKEPPVKEVKDQGEIDTRKK